MVSETIALNCMGGLVLDAGRETSIPDCLCRADMGAFRCRQLNVTGSGLRLDCPSEATTLSVMRVDSDIDVE